MYRTAGTGALAHMTNSASNFKGMKTIMEDEDQQYERETRGGHSAMSKNYSYIDD
jgi:hypothetical protein